MLGKDKNRAIHVSNVWDNKVYCKLLLDSAKTFKMLTGQKLEISYLFSAFLSNGFTHATFALFEITLYNCY